jgi:hypothetical protein
VAGRESAPEPAATPEELPSIDTLDEHSKLGAFFAEAVCEDLRRRALRKIFHLGKYNVCDGLDDYAEDYTCFEPLGDIMTADQRLRREREQLKRALEQGEGAPEDEPDNTQDSPPEGPATQRVEHAGAPVTGEDAPPGGDAGEEPVRQI